MIFLRKKIVIIFLVAIFFCFLAHTFLFFYERHLEEECKKGINSETTNLAVHEAHISLLKGTILLQGVTLEMNNEHGKATLSIEGVEASKLSFFSLQSLTPVLLAKKVTLNGIRGNIALRGTSAKFSLSSVSFGEVWGAPGLFDEGNMLSNSSALRSIYLYEGWFFGLNVEGEGKDLEWLSPRGNSVFPSSTRTIAGKVALGLKADIELLRFSSFSTTSFEDCTVENIRIQDNYQNKLTISSLHLDKGGVLYLAHGIPLPLFKNFLVTRVRVKKSKDKELRFESAKLSTGASYDGVTTDFLLNKMEFSPQMLPFLQNIAKERPRDSAVDFSSSSAKGHNNQIKKNGILKDLSMYSLTANIHLTTFIEREKDSGSIFLHWQADPLSLDFAEILDLSGKAEGKFFVEKECPIAVTGIDVTVRKRTKNHAKYLSNTPSCLDSDFIYFLLQQNPTLQK